MGSSLGTELALQAFMIAFIRRRPPRTLLFHSDRGVQYTSHAEAGVWSTVASAKA